MNPEFIVSYKVAFLGLGLLLHQWLLTVGFLDRWAPPDKCRQLKEMECRGVIRGISLFLPYSIN